MTEPNELNGNWQDLVDHCFDLYKKFKESKYRQKKLDAIARSVNAYNQEPEGNPDWLWDDAFNIVLPLYTITLDNLEPRMVAAMIGKEPYVKLDMEGTTKQDQPTEILQTWFNDELKNVVEIAKGARGILHKLLKEGTVFVIPKYAMEEKTVLDFMFEGDPGMIPGMDQMTGTPMMMDAETQQPLTPGPNGMMMQDGGKPRIVEKKELVFEGVRTDILEFGEVFVADDADDWESAEVIRKVSIPYGQLMNLRRHLGYIEANIGPDLLPSATDDRKGDEAGGEQELNEAQVLAKKTVDCLECHVSYVWREEGQADEDIEDWTEERLVALISENTKTLLRLVKRRELRFSNEQLVRRFRLFPEANLSYGSSIYEKLKGIQEAATDMFNLFMNISILIMLPWYLYSNKAGIKGNQKIIPGKGVECDNPGEVKFPELRAQVDACLKGIDMLLQLNDKMGNIGGVQTGQIEQGKSDVKATEVMAAVQEANIKFNYSASTIQEDFIGYLRAIWDLYYQNMPYNRTFIHQGQPVPIPRPLMRRKDKFRLTGSTELSNKLMERREAETAYGQLRPDPAINPIPLIEKVLKSYYPDDDPKEFLNQDIQMYILAVQKNPELPQVIGQYLQGKAVQQAAEQQMAQGQSGGGGAPQEAPPQQAMSQGGPPIA